MSIKQQYSEIINPKVANRPKDGVQPPPGFDMKGITTKSSPSLTNKKHTQEALDELKSKKIWEHAISPAKSIPMNMIMSYMMGNSLQIISITMTFMLLINPIKAIFNDTNKMFSKLSDKNNANEILMAKVAFVLLQLANLLIGVYKLYNMNLIPHNESDWLAWKEPREFIYKLSK